MIHVQNKKSDLDNVSKDDRVKLLSILALHEINTKIVDPEHFKLGRERQVGHTYLLPKKNNSFNFVSNFATSFLISATFAVFSN